MFKMLVSAYILGIVVAMPPGSVTIEIGRRAIAFGFRPAFTFNLGSISADAFYVLLVYLGLSALIADSEVFRLALWLVGGAWLIYLGWEATQTRLEITALDEKAPREALWRGYLSGVGVTLLNPLTILGWFSVAGNFFASWESGWGDIRRFGIWAVLAMLIGVMTWMLGLMTLLSRLRHLIHPKAISLISIGAGLFLIVYGLRSWWLAADLLWAF